MASSVVSQLCSIRDVLDEQHEPICAAHLQLVIDTLSERPGFFTQDLAQHDDGSG
jgi:hypothetical protein